MNADLRNDIEAHLIGSGNWLAGDRIRHIDVHIPIAVAPMGFMCLLCDPQVDPFNVPRSRNLITSEPIHFKCEQVTVSVGRCDRCNTVFAVWGKDSVEDATRDPRRKQTKQIPGFPSAEQVTRVVNSFPMFPPLAEIRERAKAERERERVHHNIKPGAIQIGEDGLCKCDCATRCPFGKTGMQTRCTGKEVMDLQNRLTKIATTNRFFNGALTDPVSIDQAETMAVDVSGILPPIIDPDAPLIVGPEPEAEVQREPGPVVKPDALTFESISRDIPKEHAVYDAHIREKGATQSIVLLVQRFAAIQGEADEMLRIELRKLIPDTSAASYEWGQKLGVVTRRSSVSEILYPQTRIYKPIPLWFWEAVGRVFT